VTKYLTKSQCSTTPISTQADSYGWNRLEAALVEDFNRSLSGGATPCG
jgi:hypothetical protein